MTRLAFNPFLVRRICVQLKSMVMNEKKNTHIKLHNLLQILYQFDLHFKFFVRLTITPKLSLINLIIFLSVTYNI